MGVGYAGPRVESVIGRQKWNQMTEMPFAHSKGTVVGLPFQPRCDSDLRLWQANCVFWCKHSGEHTSSNWIPAGEQTCSGGTTNARGSVKAGERDTFISHTVNGRGKRDFPRLRDSGVPREPRHVAVAHIIEVNDEEVWPPRTPRRGVLGEDHGDNQKQCDDQRVLHLLSLSLSLSLSLLS